jgi:hypothetical protein
MNQHLTDEQIWDIIDGNATPELIEKHTSLLNHDMAYRQHFASFDGLHQLLLNLPTESPSMRFEQNIMERLPKAPVRRAAYRLPLVFAVGLLSIMLWLWLHMPQAVSLPLAASPSFMQSLNIEKVHSWLSNPLFFNTFLMLNALFLYVFLDKGVFKPYFDKKIRQEGGKA